MRTFSSTRVLAAITIAAGLTLTAGCSSSGGSGAKKSSVAPVLKASDITAAIKHYQQAISPDLGLKVCQQLFPKAPDDIVGTDASGVEPSVSVQMDYLDLTCQFYGTNCDAEFAVSLTSSGRDDPKGLVPYNKHFSDHGDDNGVQITEVVGSDSQSTTGCSVTTAMEKTSIPYLNDALARVAKD